MLTFPVLKFWRLTPVEFAAAVLWNSCEILGLKCPYAPQLFARIMGLTPPKPVLWLNYNQRGYRHDRPRPTPQTTSTKQQYKRF